MATILIEPKNLARDLRSVAANLEYQAAQCQSIQQSMRSQLNGGYAPNTVKTNIDALLVPVGAAIDAARVQLDALSFKAIRKYQIGAPAGLQWFRLGGDDQYLFKSVDSTAWGKHCITYYDPSPLLGLTAPNLDLFLGLAVGDVIHVRDSGDNDGSYQVLWAPVTKGDNATYGLTQGDFSGGGSDWTAATDWTVSGGDASYSASSGTTPRTLTQALSGMATATAYAIQFELTINGVSPVGAIRCDIGGSVYWQKSFTAIEAKQTIVFFTDSPSTTPTLTFTATRVSGTVGLVIDNVYVYGAQGLVVTPEFASDSGESAYTSMSLEQTVA